MRLITPIPIEGVRLVSSSLAEDDELAWNPATHYAPGDRCMLVSTHSVYERLIDGTTAGSPDVDEANWERVGPTNKWAMFDGATGTFSTAEGSLTITIKPGFIAGLALLDLRGNKVTVTMVDGVRTVYTKVISLNAGQGVYDWYTYFFAPIVLKRNVVLMDLPPYSNAEITVTIEGEGEVAIGTLVAGPIFSIGGTRYGMELGFIDYSTDDTDKYGVTTLTKRKYAKRMSVPFVVPNSMVDEVLRQMGELRATFVVIVGAVRFESSIIYGLLKDAKVLVSYDQVSEGTVTVKGVV